MRNWEQVYEIYIELWNKEKAILGDELPRHHTKAEVRDIVQYMTDQTKTNTQIAVDLVIADKTPYTFKTAISNMLKSNYLTDENFIPNVEKRARELELTGTDRDLVAEVKHDILTMQDIQSKYLNDIEYRKVFNTLMYAGIGKNNKVFHAFFSDGEIYINVF